MELRWDAIGAIGNLSLSLVAAYSLPQIQNWLHRPKLKIKIRSPFDDHEYSYWHFSVRSKGGVAKDVGLYLMAIQYQNEKIKDIPRIRFEWPYEVAGRDPRPLRNIKKAEWVDFFSTEKGGKVHLVLQPAILKLPDVASYLDLHVAAIGDNCISNRVVVRLFKDSEWKLEVLTRNYRRKISST